MSLPAPLLNAISSIEGGKVVLIVGAGCSFEAPTSLPLSRECSVEAHRLLVEHGILEDGECENPSDLSVVADLVREKCDDNQAELVNRLPVQRFKNASPNEGHKLAAALLLEGAISNVITLNFDLAFSHALSYIGVGEKVSTISGPEQHQQLQRANVIYLHRNIDADPEFLVLTTQSLDYAWENGWEEMVAQFALVSPVTVFAGLGSSCGVLRHSAKKIRDALPLDGNAQIFLANPEDFEQSAFAEEINISKDEYVQLGWISFMRELAKRFHSEVVQMIKKDCEDLSKQEGWVDEQTNTSTEDAGALAQQINDLGLLAFGKVRARWLLELGEYTKLNIDRVRSISDLLLTVSYIENRMQLSAKILDDGYVSFSADGVQHRRIKLVDAGCKDYRWLKIEGILRQEDKSLPLGNKPLGVRRVLACGAKGSKPENVSPPKSIVNEEEDAYNIIGGEPFYSFWEVEEIRSEVNALKELLA